MMDPADEYERLEVDEDFDLDHLGASRDASHVYVIDSRREPWRVLGIFQSGNEHEPDNEMVIENRGGDRKRVPIEQAVVDGIHRMVGDRTWKSVVEGAREQQWRLKN